MKHGANKSIHRTTTLLYGLFLISGATTLVYEISWTRQAGLLFGHTVLAGSVVLASLFFGLAIGYGVGSRLCQFGRPLRWFGGCEIMAAVWVLFVPSLFDALQSPVVIRWMNGESQAWQWFSRAGIGITIFLPATIALGATLPLMSQALSRVLGNPSHRAAIGYAWNTAGAMAGTLICTYLLLVRVGVSHSSFWAAGVGMGIGLLAIGLSRRDEMPPLNPTGGSVKGSRSASSITMMTVAGLSGFITLALEILCTRLFSLVFHNSTYTFGNVVAVFLLSLALGSAIVAWLVRRVRADTILFWCGISGAITCCVSLALFVSVTRLGYFTAGDSFVEHLLRGFGLVLGFIVVPVTVCGMIFPATWQVLRDREATGRVIGTLAMVNAIGAALGSLSASFIMLPTIGLWGGFLATSVLMIAVSILVWPRRQRYPSVAALTIGVLCIAMTAVAMPSWSMLGRDADEVFMTRRESAYGWIDVTRSKESDAWYIRQNLHYRLGGTGGDAMRERRQARLPMLLHPDPQEVLFLGMGTGVTAAGAIHHQETERIEIVELIADVTAAARELGHRNDHVLDNDRVHVTTDDARHFLLGTEQRFDVIVSDLFVPWESQTGYLYTREHYVAAAEHLNDDGLFCLWLPVYQMGQREFTMIADTFATVFPETSLWWGKLDPSKPIIGLVGAMRPIEIDDSALAARLERLNRLPGGNDPQVAKLDDLRLAAIGDWPIQNVELLNLDEHPRVEFWTPQSLMAGKLLRGAWFAKFYDDVLAKLPTSDVSIDSGSFLGDAAEVQEGRQTQRFLLFGQ
ncbi:fused MFS/spermidine synthase [Rhodopirellula europaea]|uniref:Spermine/spermidine synthase family protein n=1 Tax=Rhodopirellula europaea SH398 TaxID=1263868 RepID=M5RUU5_9BACT|nr:fused MFS/spermidine synthase [Rhodopirellula europaea]EMI23075.1 spermine/spermidine synthase family protein [Rhodopirellula europaea SH398]